MREREHATRRLHEAKERMDEALQALEKAEDEWHQACLEMDRIEAAGTVKAGDQNSD